MTPEVSFLFCYLESVRWKHGEKGLFEQQTLTKSLAKSWLVLHIPALQTWTLRGYRQGLGSVKSPLGWCISLRLYA